MCSREYTDLASIASLPKFTCGQLYYYPSFNRDKDGVKLTHEIVHNLTRTTGQLDSDVLIQSLSASYVVKAAHIVVDHRQFCERALWSC